MWQVAVLWCYVESVSTVKVAARLGVEQLPEDGVTPKYAGGK